MNTKHTSAREIIEEIVPCQDCGGYVSDHQGVQGDCNYEAGTKIVDQALDQLLALLEGEAEEIEQVYKLDAHGREYDTVMTRVVKLDRLKKLMGNTGKETK